MASAKEIPELAQKSNSSSQQETNTSHTPENRLVSGKETSPALQNQDSDLPQDRMHSTAQPYSKPVPAGRFTTLIKVPARHRPRMNSIAFQDDLHREHARDHGSGRSDHRPVSSLEDQSHVVERRGSRPSIRSNFSQCSSQNTVSVYNPSEPDSGSRYAPSESSVASSAHSVTRGFVDCETHAPLDIRSSGPKVHSDFVDTGTTDVATVVERIRKAKNVSERRYYLKALQGAILPSLSRKRNIRGVAKCMLVNDKEIQEMAASLLQRHLLQLTNRNDEEFTEDLLAVAESTRAAFDQSNDKDAHAHLLGLLHLMVLSALLTRCPKPSSEQCAPLLFSTERGKQKTEMSSGKQEMTGALCVFSKTFNTCLHETSCPVWANTDMNQNTTRKMFRGASTTERLVYAFTLLNEVSAHARQHLSVELLSTLSDLKDAFHKYPTDSKGKEKDCVRFAFHLLLVRGLTFLLDTTFKEALIPVGEPAHDLTRLIVNLIVDILESDRNRQASFNRLEPETLILPFHRDPFVRRTFSLFLQGQPQHSIAISNVKHHLRKYRFCRTGKAKPKCVSKSCEWYEADCTFQDTEARLVMLVLQHTCLAEGPNPKKCLEGHFAESVKTSADVRTKRRKAAERARSFQHNLDMLVKLSHDCTHLLILYAFQYSPFPFFITEATQNRRLLHLLLTHREARKWLKRDVLLKVLCQVVEALLFLKQKDIVLRDVTCFNMLVEARKRDAGTLDILPSASFVIKVVDLGQARHVTDPVYPYVSILKVAAEDQEPVPVRWTSPEALKDGEYSHKSEVYSAGCVGSELFTHGNQPFSSYDCASTTEQLLLKMLQEPGSITLHHWPCIPDDVFDLISRCTQTDSRKRPTLQHLADELKHLKEQSHTDSQSVFGLEEAYNYPNRYPPLSPVQLERNNMPEKEIPSAVKQFIGARDPGESRHKHRGSRGKCKVTKEELQPPDSITIENKDGETSVTEKVSEKWCVEVLPALEANSLLGVTCWTSLNKTIYDRDTSSARLKQHERRYPLCIDLLSAAKCQCFWNNTQFSLDEGYAGACSPDLAARCYHVLESLTHAVLVMHEQGFCHCDIKAANILIDRHTGNVVLPRIGRVCRLTSPEALVSTSVYEDSLRWLAPEVALGLDYENAWCGPASDVFMLGTTIWELYNVRQLTATDPAADARHLAPFPSVPKNQVLNVSRSEGSLEKPQDCPQWLYDLICQCRHPDHAKRPSCQDILNVLRQHRDSAPLPSPFWTDANSTTRVRTSHSSGDGDGSRGGSGLLKKFRRRGEKSSGPTFYAPADPEYYTLDESRILRGTSTARVDKDEGSDQMYANRIVMDDDGNDSAPQLPARNRMAKGPRPGTPDPSFPYSVPAATATSRRFSAGRSPSPEPDYESD